jgi:hypothetical protein
MEFLVQKLFKICDFTELMLHCHILMGKRGSKQKFTDISCPNHDFKFCGIFEK